MTFAHEQETDRPVTASPAWEPPSLVETKGQLFARLMDEELSRLEKGPDEPITRVEFLDALGAVYERAPTEIQDDIYTLARELVAALKETRIPP